MNIGKSTLSRIKTDFVAATLKRTALRIRAAQEVVVREWNLFQEGELSEYTKGHFSVGSVGEGAALTMRYVKHMRFLDMKDPRRKISTPRRQGYHLYNRITFGTLYNYTLPSIRDGFTQEVKEEFATRIAEALGIPVDQLEQQIAKQMRQNALNLN